jgi:predicted DNA binding CopG/RHH family protein
MKSIICEKSILRIETSLPGPSSEKDSAVLISIKIPSRLLSSFRILAKLEGVKYQTKIKELMKKALET